MFYYTILIWKKKNCKGIFIFLPIQFMLIKPLYELRNHVLHKAILIEKNTKKTFCVFFYIPKKNLEDFG